MLLVLVACRQLTSDDKQPTDQETEVETLLDGSQYYAHLLYD